MTLIEQIEVMKHFENGGEVEFWSTDTKTWIDAEPPRWNWGSCKYRKKPKPVELLYEHWYNLGGQLYVDDRLRTNPEAQHYFLVKNTMEYGKTGRWFNPKTKEFGTSNL